ncbi:MAG: hypothetical protein ACTSVF_03580 [Candidatus Asgardarchaeia archaeon]
MWLISDTYCISLDKVAYFSLDASPSSGYSISAHLVTGEVIPLDVTLEVSKDKSIEAYRSWLEKAVLEGSVDVTNIGNISILRSRATPKEPVRQPPQKGSKKSKASK